MQRRKNIGLLDHMGGGNLGDDATQTAVIKNIKERWPDCEICAFSMNPADTQSRHNVRSYPLRAWTWVFGGEDSNKEPDLRSKLKSAAIRYGGLYKLLRFINSVTNRLPREVYRELSFLIKSFNIIRSFNLLVISGGGQLMDLWGGPWGFPYTIFKWIVLAKLARVKCIVLNVGAGPLEYRLSKYFIKKGLSLSDYVSFRDNKSLALIRDIGFDGEADVFPDCVYGLDMSEFVQDYKRTDILVGIAPMAYADPNVYPEHDRADYDHLIHVLGHLGSRLVRSNHRLALFCSDIGVDPPAIKDLEANLRMNCDPLPARSIAVPFLKSGSDLLVNMASMDYIVTCRFHGVVFAHMLNRPVIAISHHPKMTTLMSNLGLEDYCVDMHTCNADILINKFESLMHNGPVIKRRMAEKYIHYNQQLVKQFDQLFQKSDSLVMGEAEDTSEISLSARTT